MTITDEQRRQFETEGWMLLPAALPAAHLEALRSECQRFIDRKDAEMDALGVDSLELNRRGSRYFLSNHHDDSPLLREVLFSPLMAAICRATIGEQAWLYNEQYVVKAAERGMAFGWHQDSGYGEGVAHRPYITCWCPLDDVDERNGTVFLLPYSRAGTRELIPHREDPATRDLVGYFGDDPGDPVIAPAGSVAVFASTVFHRSGANTTNAMRRVFVAQYSPEPILDAEGRPQTRAEPFLGQEATPVA